MNVWRLPPVPTARESLLALCLTCLLMTACGPTGSPAAIQTVSPAGLEPGLEAECVGLDGMMLADAELLAASRGLTARVVSVAGVGSLVTLDYVRTRVNLDIEYGIVTGCRLG